MRMSALIVMVWLGPRLVIMTWVAECASVNTTSAAMHHRRCVLCVTVKRIMGRFGRGGC